MFQAIGGAIQIALYYLRNHERLGNASVLKQALMAIDVSDPNSLNSALPKLRILWKQRAAEGSIGK